MTVNTHNLEKTLEKLKESKFTGRLEIHLQDGKPCWESEARALAGAESFILRYLQNGEETAIAAMDAAVVDAIDAADYLEDIRRHVVLQAVDNLGDRGVLAARFDERCGTVWTLTPKAPEEKPVVKASEETPEL